MKFNFVVAAAEKGEQTLNINASVELSMEEFIHSVTTQRETTKDLLAFAQEVGPKVGKFIEAIMPKVVDAITTLNQQGHEQRLAEREREQARYRTNEDIAAAQADRVRREEKRYAANVANGDDTFFSNLFGKKGL